MKRMNKSLLVLLCMTTGSMAGCDDSNDVDSPAGEASLELVPPDEVGALPVVELAPEDVPLVARIDGEQEGMIEFLDVSEFSGDDEILVVAVGPEGGGVTHFIDEGSSPLEVYLAMAPSEAPPARLVENHSSLAAQGIVPTTPRELQMWRETNTGSDCVNGGGPGDVFQWWTDWHNGYGTNTGFQQFAVASTFAGGTKITVSNTTKRALEACAWDHRSELDNVYLQTLSGGVWWTLSSYTRPVSGDPWGVAIRSISPSGTLSARLVVTNYWNDTGTISWFAWGGAYS
ncbi:hypothetical protein [Enhygromyxa salina]|uniref:CAP domain-containing protein n=1 Tax=Enhygromyxa salina TaxID=215803 RepID=A0A2S9YPC1_9BACT|nr:hypothetical protein [Enhygromyxa salina]PRQ06945.1 hypothetical protein ENSA7_33690 [Enhygromyxa salina]